MKGFNKVRLQVEIVCRCMELSLKGFNKGRLQLEIVCRCMKVSQ